MFYGCETNPMNQPIEEKWKVRFRCEFTTIGEGFSDRKWYGYPSPDQIESFIENLLEQERAERDNFWAKNEESRLKNYEALGYHKGKMAERKRMSEVLTVNLDMSQMLDGWDKYWIDAKNGRYIEGCAECGNSKRIKESIINK